ncbi:general transcriptional corepressor trfA-like [Centruroides sculpturatus]|uniref:general transcriptional corepressor trfA-like n=1 Tax=Centruroides sculpturatus TaxID=218467 RepID=UPI000C6EB320|nr:general transcriptional corepressor trfA-like [Centruroides sculpturatus]
MESYEFCYFHGLKKIKPKNQLNYPELKERFETKTMEFNRVKSHTSIAEEFPTDPIQRNSINAIRRFHDLKSSVYSNELSDRNTSITNSLTQSLEHLEKQTTNKSMKNGLNNTKISCNSSCHDNFSDVSVESNLSCNIQNRKTFYRDDESFNSESSQYSNHRIAAEYTCYEPLPPYIDDDDYIQEVWSKTPSISNQLHLRQRNLFNRNHSKSDYSNYTPSSRWKNSPEFISIKNSFSGSVKSTLISGSDCSSSNVTPNEGYRNVNRYQHKLSDKNVHKDRNKVILDDENIVNDNYEHEVVMNRSLLIDLHDDRLRKFRMEFKVTDYDSGHLTSFIEMNECVLSLKVEKTIVSDLTDEKCYTKLEVAMVSDMDKSNKHGFKRERVTRLTENALNELIEKLLTIQTNSRMKERVEKAIKEKIQKCNAML